MSTIANGQNLKFLRGVQDKLPQGDKIVEGAFYLTTDSHRLYIGQKDEASGIKELHLLSQAVKIVTSLPSVNSVETGTIYYATDTNVLGIHNGTGWTQLNPDTYVTSFVNSTEATDDGVKVTTTLTENRGTTPTKSTNFTIKGDKGVKVSNTGNVITVAAPELAMAENTAETGATVTLDKKSFDIVGGENTTVSVSGTTITVDSSYVDHQITAGSVAIETADEGFTIGGSLTDNLAGTFNLTSGTLNPVIKVATGKNAEGQLTYNAGSKFVTNGTATLDVYDTAAIDSMFQEKLNEINSMTYKGKLTANAEGVATLPTKDVSVGDTWMLGEAASVNGENYMPGTIFVATGKETNGVITADLTWDSVKTSDSDTTFKLKNSEGNKVSLISSVGSAEAGSVEFAEGTDGLIDIAVTSGTNKENTVVTLSHATVTVTPETVTKATQTKGQAQSVTAITAIETDGHGHINKVSTQEVELIDTITTLDSNTITVEAGTQPEGSKKTSAVVTSSVKTTEDAVAKTASLTLESESLTVSTATGKVGLELTWGEF